MGSQAAFLKKIRVPLPQWHRYVRGERLPELAVLCRIAKGSNVTVAWLLTGTNRPAPALTTVQESLVPYVAPEWQDREWQQTHGFTALVESLKDLERIPMTSGNAWRTRVAWETLLCAGEVVRTLSSWKDRDWERIYRKGLDHWLRPKFGIRAERTMLKERLSIQLELEEDESG